MGKMSIDEDPDPNLSEAIRNHLRIREDKTDIFLNGTGTARPPKMGIITRPTEGTDMNNLNAVRKTPEPSIQTISIDAWLERPENAIETRRLVEALRDARALLDRAPLILLSDSRSRLAFARDLNLLRAKWRKGPGT